MAQREWGRNIGAQSKQTRTRLGNGKKSQRRENRNTHSDNGEGTTDKSRADSGTKKMLSRGSWRVCAFATEERKSKEIAEQVSKRDLDIVENQESWEKEGGGEQDAKLESTHG